MTEIAKKRITKKLGSRSFFKKYPECYSLLEKNKQLRHEIRQIESELYTSICVPNPDTARFRAQRIYRNHIKLPAFQYPIPHLSWFQALSDSSIWNALPPGIFTYAARMSMSIRGIHLDKIVKRGYLTGLAAFNLVWTHFRKLTQASENLILVNRTWKTDFWEDWDSQEDKKGWEKAALEYNVHKCCESSERPGCCARWIGMNQVFDLSYRQYLVTGGKIDKSMLWEKSRKCHVHSGTCHDSDMCPVRKGTEFFHIFTENPLCILPTEISKQIVDFCLALCPLRLPSYVILWILDWLPVMDLLPEIYKISLISNIAKFYKNRPIGLQLLKVT